jgi:DNA repair protein RadC
MRIKDLPVNERPRERLINCGIENLSNEELLAIIIKTGTRNKSVKEIASELLCRIDSLNNLEMININTFTNINGLGKVKTMELMAVIELGKRIFLKKENKKINYNNPGDIYLENKYLFSGKKQEYFYCLYLDNKNKLIEKRLLFIGTINQSLVHPREVFKYAYINSASSIVIVHNHPSGDITPSKEDINITNVLKELGSINKIPILDHIIIGHNNYYSFNEELML